MKHTVCVDYVANSDIIDEAIKSAKKVSRTVRGPHHRLGYTRMPNWCLSMSYMFVNAIIFFIGLITVAITVYHYVNISPVYLGHEAFIPTIFFIAVFPTIISFLGMLAYLLSLPVLLSFCILLQALYMWVLYITSVLSFTLFDRLLQELMEEMYESLKLYDTDPWLKTRWDITQVSLRCCGVQDPDEWLKNTKKGELPQSCCNTELVGLSNCPTPMTLPFAYEAGCFTVAKTRISSRMSMGGICLLFLGISEIMIVVLTIGLRMRMTKRCRSKVVRRSRSKRKSPCMAQLRAVLVDRSKTKLKKSSISGHRKPSEGRIR